MIRRINKRHFYSRLQVCNSLDFKSSYPLFGYLRNSAEKFDVRILEYVLPKANLISGDILQELF